MVLMAKDTLFIQFYTHWKNHGINSLFYDGDKIIKIFKSVQYCLMDFLHVIVNARIKVIFFGFAMIYITLLIKL